MEFQNFCFAYKKREPESLHIPRAELPVGETIAIIGLNGAGKSTLARCSCGLEKKCGRLQVDGKTLDWKARLKHCYMVMQDTSHQLFTESVTDEVLLSTDNKDETVVDKILKQFDLLEYKDRHPLSLSGGQKQRVADVYKRQPLYRMPGAAPSVFQRNLFKFLPPLLFLFLWNGQQRIRFR